MLIYLFLHFLFGKSELQRAARCFAELDGRFAMYVRIRQAFLFLSIHGKDPHLHHFLHERQDLLSLYRRYLIPVRIAGIGNNQLVSH